MDGNTNDQDPDALPDVSPEELKEALEWLDELTGRVAAKPAVEETPTLDSSPFNRLPDESSGDLPDWLREAQPTPAEPPLSEQEEYESRMDWLAQMAERESIEELPTLEWRRLSESNPPAAAEGRPAAAESEHDTLPPARYLSDQFPLDESPSEPLAAEVIPHVPSEDEMLPAGEPTPVEDGMTDDTLPATVAAESEAALEWLAQSEPEALATNPAADVLMAELPEVDSPASITPETLLDSLPPDVELPPIDDLDAAMAWIEELAASQDAPIEDVPSVADRALTSKLLMEAGLSPDALNRRGPEDELALGDLSLLEGNTPINAFVAAEDFADTIVLVETMAADQGRTLEPPDEPPAAITPAEATFDDAMAFLDELAAAQEPLGSVTQPIAPVEAGMLEIEELATDTLSEPPADEEPLGAVTQLLESTVTELEATPADVETTHDEGVGEVEIVVADVDLMVDEGEDLSEAMDIPALPEEAVTMVEDAFPDETFLAEEALLVEEAPWLEETGDTTADPAGEAVLLATGAAELSARANGDHAPALEETLRRLDALALPPGRSLAEVDASLRQGGASPAQRNLPAAVEWLELALGISVPTPVPTPAVPTSPSPPSAPPTDDELVARMPDDPDAVLAWLEQLAEEDTLGSSPTLTAEEAAPAEERVTVADRPAMPDDEAVVELSEDDLLSMPDDPDAVIAWLEGLAGTTPIVSPTAEAAPPTDAPAPAPPLTDQPYRKAATVSSRPRRRRRRGAEAAPPDEPVAPAMELEPGGEPAGPETTAEVSQPALPGAEETPATSEWAKGAWDSEASAMPTVEHMAVTKKRVPVTVRRRGERRPQATAEAAPAEYATPGAKVYEMAESMAAVETDVTDEPVDTSADTEETFTQAEAPRAEPPPAPKPSSWVDLLKPLR